MSPRLVSVVLPVRNEHENIRPCLEALAAALASVDHEILVVYDSEDDTTLAALSVMGCPPPSLRLLRNCLGPSPSFAIRAGLAAARGDVVVVSMADLSDPPEAILRMAEKIRAGADVVSGSRYMPGGRQIGGPPLKTVLSRMAGFSLWAVAGLRTRDATTSFRGFSRRFLDSVPLESTVGFTFAIEATVKAHRRGLVVDEVPVTWVDRTAGASNFRVARWLPAYLRWYAAAMAEPVIVAAAWLALAWRTARFDGDPSLAAAATGGAAATIVAARWIRGRTTLVDALAPMAWWTALSVDGAFPGLLGSGANLVAAAAGKLHRSRSIR